MKSRNRAAALYLRDHVDPILKSLIKRAVRGPQPFPADFQEWLWTQLCFDLGKEKSHVGVDTVPEAVQSLNELAGRSKQAFISLDRANYESTHTAFAQVCWATEVLEQQYAKDRQGEAAQMRAAEDAKKRKAAVEAEKKRAAEEAKKRAAEEQQMMLAKDRITKTVDNRSPRQAKIMLSGRFDGDYKETLLRGVARHLAQLVGDQNVIAVSTAVGSDFGPLVMKALVDMDVMVAFGFEDYGQKTGSRFSTVSN